MERSDDCVSKKGGICCICNTREDIKCKYTYRYQTTDRVKICRSYVSAIFSMKMKSSNEGEEKLVIFWKAKCEIVQKVKKSGH